MRGQSLSTSFSVKILSSLDKTYKSDTRTIHQQIVLRNQGTVEEAQINRI